MKLGWCLLLACLSTACGASSSSDDEPNNGGKTNWLKGCEVDGECGTLACIVQVCTRECESASDCSDVDGDATCGQLLAGRENVCTRACEAHDDCSNDQFCYKPSCDEPGECRQSEGMGCDGNYEPVCGCDGQTYGNACMAATAAAGVDTAGECADAGCQGDDCAVSGSSCEGKRCGDPCVCAPNDPECAPTDEPKYCDSEGRCHGSLDECSPSACETRDPESCEEFGCWAYVGTRASDGVNAPLGCLGADAACEDVLTCSIDPDGECWQSSACVPDDFEEVDCSDPRCCLPGECDGPRPCASNDDCGAEQYCFMEACGQPGKCEDIVPCESVYEPVCGCDGLTYSNSCEAHLTGVAISSEGECGPDGCEQNAGCACTSDGDCAEGLRCQMDGCDGGTCVDATSVDCWLDDDPVCGCDGVTYAVPCDAMWIGVDYPGQCVSGACTSSDDCPAGEHCYRDGCDAPGECRDGEEPICPPTFEPVCSCDGATTDDCVARNSGAGVDYRGECVEDYSYGAQWRRARISFGECVGDCAFVLRRDLAEPSQVVYEACDYLEMSCTRSVVLELNEDGQQLLVNAHRDFRSPNLEEQYGCPDCDDGGATMIYLETSDGVFTQHEYEYFNPPAEFQALDELLLEMHQALDDCSDGAYFSIVGECTSPE